MRPYSGFATFSKEAERLFSNIDTARETVAKILAAQAGGPRIFEVDGVVMELGGPPSDDKPREK